MKILLVCNYFQPKLSYAESEIANALLKMGHKIEIITGDRYFPFPNYNSTVKKVLGNRVVGIGKRNESGFPVDRQKVYLEFFSRACFFGIFQKIKSFNPDIVLTFGLTTPGSIQVALLKIFFKYRFIGVDSHLPSELFSSNVLIKKMFYFSFRLCFSNLINNTIDKIIAAQEGTKDIVIKYYGLNKNIFVISHGTNIKLFKFNSIARRKIRKELNLKTTDFLIIYTGKIIKSKGIHILTEAFSKLSEKYKNTYLLLVGSGPSEYKNVCLNDLAKKINKRIFWEEFKKFQELPDYYSAADVAIWPLQESLSMNDAASCSLPFIANDKVGVKERISNNNALLYAKGNALDLSKKIEILYLDKVKRKKMGRNGRNLVKNSLSWDSVAKKYLS